MFLIEENAARLRKVIREMSRTQFDWSRDSYGFLATVRQGLNSLPHPTRLFRRQENTIMTAGRAALTKLAQRKRNLEGRVVDSSLPQLTRE